MPILVGDKLGPYEILERIGAGGMGEVYRARDLRLDRDVAIKVSAERFTERFEREARAIAALNHPNICQLYDIGPNYLVMEFIDGSRLAPTDSGRTLLERAIQIADGLAAAHGIGLIHRDLKPDNIMVTREGRVKILDFGLVKKTGVAEMDATHTMALTDPGTTVGTIHYMSPEQARGDSNLTPQSDQFSFGLVLYELAAGKRAFQRESAAETMAAIIREDAEPLPASIPPPLRWVIQRLMSKDPADRYDSTRDLYRELKSIRERASQSSGPETVASTAVQAKRKTPILPVSAAAVLSLLLGAALIMWLLPPPAPDISSYKFTPITRQDAAERDPAWSPDSKSIVFTTSVHGILQVFTKALDSSQAAQITHSTISCTHPIWAPDGSKIYYMAGTGLWAVPASGGVSTLLLNDVTSVGLHPDGDTVAFVRDGKMFIGSLKGGDPKPLNAPPIPNTHVGGGEFSPDGSKLLIGAGGASPALWLLPFPSGTPRKLETRPTAFEWFPDSVHVLTPDSRDGNSMTLARLNVLDLKSEVFFNSPTIMSQLAISPDGKRIAYQTGQVEWDVLEIAVPSGAAKTTLSGSGVVSGWPDWAPSGTHYLATTDRSGTYAIEDTSTAEGFSRRLAAPGSGEIRVTMPRYSPDGSRFTYVAIEFSQVKLMLANAAGGAASVIDHFSNGGESAWSPDSQWIAYARGEPNIQIVKVSPGAPASKVTIATLEQKDGPIWKNRPLIQWSPDDAWIAYPSSEGIILVSPDGKSRRKLTARALEVFGFSNDGAELLGIERNTTGRGPEWQLYSVDVKTGADKFLAPVDLPASVEAMVGFSMHPDGKRFLTSIAKWPFDIWMMEGFDQRKSWLESLFHR